MKAFKRLDHLLCDVPDIDEAFTLFHDRLCFPVAWPIGRYWPNGRTCGIALGGVNLEFIQNDEHPVSEAVIRCIAFEPTSCVREAFDRERISFEIFEKKESNPELLRLRGMPDDLGEQLLCTNVLPTDDSTLPFSFFACDYEASVKERLTASAFAIPGGNAVEEIVIGAPDPRVVTDFFARMGIEGGVRISAREHPIREVVAILMRYGPIDLGDWATRFEFVGG